MIIRYKIADKRTCCRFDLIFVAAADDDVSSMTLLTAIVLSFEAANKIIHQEP
jgi:hypothetical protein